jgi:hypothetical protein
LMLNQALIRLIDCYAPTVDNRFCHYRRQVAARELIWFLSSAYQPGVAIGLRYFWYINRSQTDPCERFN